MKNSIIVETFSRDLLKKDVDKKDLSMSNEYIRELASKTSPESVWELGQILSFVINDGFTERVNYIDQIADVKRTGYNEKAQFEIEIDDLKAMFQAKSATTERSKISTRKFSLDTDEISIRPVINFLDLKTGKQDLTKIADRAIARLEMAFVKRVQDAIYAAFKELGAANYGAGSGVTKGVFDPILHAMRRAGGDVSVLGDTEALSKFTDLSGFNGNVPSELALEHNRNGMIGHYLGASLMQLNNPFAPNSLEETELRKDLIYVIPNVENSLKPVKVQFEGDVQYIGTGVDINSKEIEFRFDQYAGVGVIGVRKLLGVYEDTALSAE